jgi:hypothetical protein
MKNKKNEIRDLAKITCEELVIKDSFQLMFGFDYPKVVKLAGGYINEFALPKMGGKKVNHRST